MMDREEAIWHLKRCKKRIPLMNTLGELCKSKTIESIDMAIEALQAKTDGDLINRADALEQIAQAECGLHYEDCKADNCMCGCIWRILNISSTESKTRE